MAPHGPLGGKTGHRALQEPSRADERALSCSCCEGQCPFIGQAVSSEQGEAGEVEGCPSSGPVCPPVWWCAA